VWKRAIPIEFRLEKLAADRKVAISHDPTWDEKRAPMLDDFLVSAQMPYFYR
jgi:hypothetical protein